MRLKQMIVGVPVALASALLVALPWLYNTFRSSGNPFFPYLGKYFSSPLWPNASPDILGDFTKYQLPGGSWQFLRWPIDFTYGGDFGVYFGGLGLSLIVLLVLAIPALQNSSQRRQSFCYFWNSWNIVDLEGHGLYPLLDSRSMVIHHGFGPGNGQTVSNTSRTSRGLLGCNRSGFLSFTLSDDHTLGMSQKDFLGTCTQEK